MSEELEARAKALSWKVLAVGRVTMYCPGKTLRGSALASDARQYGDTAARTTPINALNLDLSVKRSMPGMNYRSKHYKVLGIAYPYRHKWY